MILYCSKEAKQRLYGFCRPDDTLGTETFYFKPLVAGTHKIEMFLNPPPTIRCCFVLLEPTPKVYRVPRVSPGVTAPKLFSPTSVAGYAGPSSSLQTTPEVPVLLSEVQSGVQHLLGLISGLRRGGRGIPISSLVVEMDLLLSRRLRLSNSCPASDLKTRAGANNKSGSKFWPKKYTIILTPRFFFGVSFRVKTQTLR